MYCPEIQGIPFIANYFDNAIREGLIPPMLIVFPISPVRQVGGRNVIRLFYRQIILLVIDHNLDIIKYADCTSRWGFEAFYHGSALCLSNHPLWVMSPYPSGGNTALA